MQSADSAELAEMCDGLLVLLQNETNSTFGMQLLDFVSRSEDMSKRLLALESFRMKLEASAARDEAGGKTEKTWTRSQLNCRTALRLLYTRSTIRREQVFECIAGGGPIRIQENLAFGGQSTCKHDGTLKTGGVVWAAAHCLVDLMHHLGPAAFRGKSVLEIGAGYVPPAQSDV